MNFIRFSTGTTNIFPLANSKTGGQLMTEFNLRSRESVEVGPIQSNKRIHYMVGQSFVNSEDDFKLVGTTTSSGQIASGDSQVLMITEGRAVINGHYFESLVPVKIDIGEANQKLRKNSMQPLLGELSVGLRAMYSTTETMAGAMIAEEKNYFEGVQVVILPKSEFKLPIDCKDDQGQVTAHIKLGDIIYQNGRITNISQNYPDKCRYLDADRITNISKLMSDNYINRDGLNPGYIYGFSGKGSSTKDTWCNITDSLIVWDKSYNKATTEKPSVTNANFGTDTNGNVVLALPHKQIDGMMNTDGKQLYYQPRIMKLPKADYSSGSSGTVDHAYTQKIKDAFEKIHTKILEGKQRAYIDIITDEKRKELPPISSSWSIGDYVVVGTDNSVVASSDSTKSPSTLYIIIDGIVTQFKFNTSNKTGDVPSGLDLQITKFEWSSDKNDPIPETGSSDEAVKTYNNQLQVATSNYRGAIGTSYIVIKYDQVDKDTQAVDTTYYFYTVSAKNADKMYSDPIWLTGEINLATEESIGGFLNVPDTKLDGGYVYRDENGNLRLLDYALLRTGTLAYQLGADQEFGNGLTTESIQEQLDEYVNDRVAFPTSDTLNDSKYNGMINITLELPKEDEASIVTIRNIDSRFGTGVNINLSGEADSNTIINIVNCEKIKINSTLALSKDKGPAINLSNCSLWYDSEVIENLTYIDGLKLWYRHFDESDNNLTVSGMTVMSLDSISQTNDIDYWNEAVDNDIHYLYALQSLTFNTDGTILGAGILVKNRTTGNVSNGKSIIVSSFQLPNNSLLQYPKNRLTKQVKIYGQFISAYASDEPEGYIVIDTKFTALSQKWNTNDEDVEPGTISFLANVEHITNVVGVSYGTEIDGWATESFHPFEGKIIG